MRVAGIGVEGNAKRPKLHLVVIDDSGGSPAIVAAEEMSADDVDIVEQLYGFGRAIGSRLKGLKVDRVIVRRADVAKQASKHEGPKVRLLAEGAVTSSARAVVPDTRLEMGRDIARWMGKKKTKDDLDAEAAQLVAAAGEHSRYVIATAAALGGFQAP